MFLVSFSCRKHPFLIVEVYLCLDHLSLSF